MAHVDTALLDRKFDSQHVREMLSQRRLFYRRPRGQHHGRFSLWDRYDVTLDDASGVPKEAVIAAAVVTDAIQEY